MCCLYSHINTPMGDTERGTKRGKKKGKKREGERKRAREFLKGVGILSTGIQTSSLQESSKLLYYNTYRLMVIVQREYSKKDAKKILDRVCECMKLFDIGDEGCMASMMSCATSYGQRNFEENLYVKKHHYSIAEYSEFLESLDNREDIDQRALLSEMEFAGLARDRHRRYSESLTTYCRETLSIEGKYAGSLKYQVYNVPLCIRNEVGSIYSRRVSTDLIEDLRKHGQTSLTADQLDKIFRSYQTSKPSIAATIKHIKRLLEAMEEGQEAYERTVLLLAKKRIRIPSPCELFKLYNDDRGEMPQINPIVQNLIPSTAGHWDPSFTNSMGEYGEHRNTDTGYVDSRDRILLIRQKSGVVSYKAPEVEVRDDQILYVALKGYK